MISNGKDLYYATAEERKQFIEQKSLNDEYSPSVLVPEELHITYRFSRALDSFLLDYFKTAIDNELPTFLSAENRKALIKNEIDLFVENALENLKLDKSEFEVNVRTKPKNLYELGGAMKLAYGNNATRAISTKLGLLWERIACLSPLAISPEEDFNIKLNGVDAIIYNNDDQKTIFTQIKTQKNTLTGSQKARSITELVLHANRQLVACFDTSAGWTFNSSEVPRVCGAPFWISLGFTYDEILGELKRMMPLLDEGYIELF